LVLLQQEDGVVPAVVTRVAGSIQALHEEVTQELDWGPKVYGAGADVGLSRPAAGKFILEHMF